ncbi:MAG: cation:proton antiporter, partial [Gammaproteobacteria bacterium]|nr:cation:proton antiporter [Gammaproteobacteria bacterium]
MSSFFPNDLLGFWSEWVRPSAGLPTVLWSLLLATAAAAGHLVQRYIGLPKVVGYSLVGTIVGFAGFEGAIWPLRGISLFLVELGVAIVLFEAGGRLPLRWFRHNPRVLVQSLLEATLTYFGVYWVLRWLGVDDAAANPIALIAIVASPAVLTRVVIDTRASGPVTERAMTLATLNTFYAL